MKAFGLARCITADLCKQSVMSERRCYQSPAAALGLNPRDIECDVFLLCQ